MDELPQEVAASAYRAKNGEYAWRRRDINGALRAIAQAGYAILGGEVWAVRDGQIWGAIPDASGGPPGIWSWDTSTRRSNEDWMTYCLRAADENISKVLSMSVEDEAAPEFRDFLYFNVTIRGNRGPLAS